MTKQEFLRELWNKLTELPQEDVEKSLDYYSEMIDDRVENGLTEEEAVAEIGTADAAAAQILEGLPEKRRERKLAAEEKKAENKSEESAKTSQTQTGNAAQNAGAAQNIGTGNTTQNTGTASTAQGASAGGAAQNTGSTSQPYGTGYGGGYYSYTPESAKTSYQKKPVSAGKVIALICTFPLWFPLLMAFGAIVFALFVTIWAVTFALFVTAASFIVAGVAGVVMLFVLTIHGELALGLIYFGTGFFLAGLGILFMVFSGSVIKGVGVLSSKIWRGVTSLFGKRRAA